ncbi:MAG TPA: DUF6265 family protein [Thermoanaerobaculia bacterium]|nr:DUF6265 family protein [Thermoanaerobaculia bacterium]
MRRIACAALAIVFATDLAVALAATPIALQDLSWLAGRWIDDTGGNLSEETWSAPSGDAMLGMWRYVVEGKARVYEILRLSAEDGTLVLRLRHFDPALVAMEDKATPYVLKLVSTDPRQLVFEGSEVGAPGVVRLTYARPSDDVLAVTLEKGGQTRGFHFRRAPR